MTFVDGCYLQVVFWRLVHFLALPPAPGAHEFSKECLETREPDVARLDPQYCAQSAIKHVKLSIGGSVHDPLDPVGRLLFNVLAMVAEFESDLIRARTREGMQVAKAKGRLRGNQPKLSLPQQHHLMEVHNAGTHSTAELAELFNVARSTVYRTIQRQTLSEDKK